MTSDSAPIFVALTDEGARLAERLAAGFTGAQIHGLEGRVTTADRHFAATLDHVRLLYGEGRSIVGVFSTAIMIRALAGTLQEKADAPPVLCVAEDGGAIVPLLGGHHGANDLAYRLGAVVGVAPAVTTAGDSRFGIALDFPPPGWGISGRAAAKDIMAAMLADEAVTLVNDLQPAIDTSWISDCGARFVDGNTPTTVRLTEMARAESGDTVCLHPQTLVLGVGCERGIDEAELSDLVATAFAETGLARDSVACVTTIDLKEDETAIRAVADRMNLPLRFFSPARLEAETPRLANPSETVFAAVGCHGVAEGAALAGAGADAALALPKMKSRRATVAIARAPGIVDAGAIGRPTGLLSIVGIGPGKTGWRAPEANDVIARASDVVGYRLYIDLLGDLTRGKTLHHYELGEERDRCADALTLAASGKRVALVSSGDAGIYAMASLVFELVDQGGRPDWERLAVEVVPGISALQALAARSGAPLGHDFCAISLSDLMTPWAVIEDRLRAAADGDFVIALYNPVSKRRTTQLMRAREILLAARRPETPVILGQNLGREGERIDVITLQELESSAVDMLTTVIVGSSTTRTINGGPTTKVYTPRGYESRDTKS